MLSPSNAAWCINFFGMHPTLTQVPPSPHLVPCGEGVTQSSTATRAPLLTASFAHASPPDPPPMTARSQSNVPSTICVMPSACVLQTSVYAVHVSYKEARTTQPPINHITIPLSRALMGATVLVLRLQQIHPPVVTNN